MRNEDAPNSPRLPILNSQIKFSRNSTGRISIPKLQLNGVDVQSKESSRWADESKSSLSKLEELRYSLQKIKIKLNERRASAEVTKFDATNAPFMSQRKRTCPTTTSNDS